MRIGIIIASILFACGGNDRGENLPPPERQSRTLIVGGGQWRRFDVTLDVPAGWSSELAEAQAGGPIEISNPGRSGRNGFRLSSYFLCEPGDTLCGPSAFGEGEVPLPSGAGHPDATVHVRAGLRTCLVKHDERPAPSVVVEHLVPVTPPLVVVCEAIGGLERLVDACSAMVIGPLIDLVPAEVRAREDLNVGACPAGTRLELTEIVGRERKVTAKAESRAHPGGKSLRTLSLSLTTAGTSPLVAIDVVFTGKPGEEVLSGDYGYSKPLTHGASVELRLDGEPKALGGARYMAQIVARTATRVCGKLLLTNGDVRFAATFDAPLIDLR